MCKTLYSHKSHVLTLNVIAKSNDWECINACVYYQGQREGGRWLPLTFQKSYILFLFLVKNKNNFRYKFK